MRIQTERLELIAGNCELLRRLIYERRKLEKLLQVKIPEHFSEFGTPPLQYAMEKLQNIEEAGWWTYLPVLTQAQMIIGTCGYKGKPDQDGMVEIGYEVIKELRNKGYAKEIARGLIANAFRYVTVKTVRAHTLREENASVNVLRSCGMKFIGDIEDPEDGFIWRWEVSR